MTKFFIFKKPCFWPIFPIFGTKNFFLENSAVTHFTWVFSTMPKFRKTNDTIPRKCPDRRKDERTDRPYFIGPFQLMLGVQQLYYVIIIYLLNLFLNSALLFFGPQNLSATTEITIYFLVLVQRP